MWQCGNVAIWQFGHLFSCIYVINICDFQLPKSENVCVDAAPAGTPENGFLFSYPIVSKGSNGIMVIAETLAGG